MDVARHVELVAERFKGGQFEVDGAGLFFGAALSSAGRAPAASKAKIEAAVSHRILFRF
jgi:hypothetical protein